MKVRDHHLWFGFLVLVLGWPSHATASSPDTGPLCSAAWYNLVEQQVTTGDGQGHGPDVGSEEWKSVVEFRLGIRDTPGVPPRDGEAWCRYIDGLVWPGAGSARGPSFDCGAVEVGSGAARVCADPELAALDHKLAEVYAAALGKANNEHPPVLRAEQRGWIKGRDDCWKSDDQDACMREAYVTRIAELQARYRLVPFIGPVFYACEGNPAHEVVATTFHTEPPTLIAEYGDSVSLMFLQPSASGTKYQGGNETFWEHQGEARIAWGYGAPEWRCVKNTADAAAR